MTAPRVPYIEQAVPFSERKLSTVLATPGVAARRQVHRRGSRSGSGRTGGRRACRSSASISQPGSARRGTSSPARSTTCASPTPCSSTRSTAQKLGVDRIGEVVEIRGRRARIVGFTRGIRSFTTSPYVFTTFKNAQDYADLREDQTLYLLVKAAPGVDVEALRQTLTPAADRRRRRDQQPASAG